MSDLSEKQLQANRENAKLGGVKTEEGKAVSKYNAMKHGLLTEEIVLADEDAARLEELGKRLRITLKPEGELELILVERIIANVWRLRRVLKAEKEMIDKDMALEKNFGSALGYDLANYDSYGKFTRYEASIERGLFRALHELQRLQAGRNGGQAPPPIMVDVINYGEAGKENQ